MGFIGFLIVLGIVFVWIFESADNASHQKVERQRQDASHDKWIREEYENSGGIYPHSYSTMQPVTGDHYKTKILGSSSYDTTYFSCEYVGTSNCVNCTRRKVISGNGYQYGSSEKCKYTR